MGLLDGFTTIITGAAQGIGAAYAKGMAAEGANVVVNDIDDPGPVVAEIAATGGRALGVVADITDAAQVDDMVARTVGTYGRIDGLVNNAALFGTLKRKRFEEIDAAEFDAVMRINVRGTWQVSRAVVPVMREQRFGKIVNIASGTAFKGSPMHIHYVASKGAIIAFSRALAREVGEDNICVNTIAPGLTASEAVLTNGEFDAGHIDANIAGRCLRRAETPEDLVGTAVFLVSHDSDFITGQVLCVDGGSVVN